MNFPTFTRGEGWIFATSGGEKKVSGYEILDRFLHWGRVQPEALCSQVDGERRDRHRDRFPMTIVARGHS